MDSHFSLTMPMEVVCLGLEVITPHNNFLRDSNDDSTAALLSFKPSIANPQSSFIIGLKMIFKSTSSLDFAQEELIFTKMTLPKKFRFFFSGGTLVCSDE